MNKKEEASKKLLDFANTLEEPGTSQLTVGLPNDEPQDCALCGLEFWGTAIIHLTDGVCKPCQSKK